MVDYGRNLVGNIKVKTRSSGGDFVDMGKTKSDIDKNIHEMEKLVGEIKANPRYSSDSGKMINDLKEDIRKLKLIKYDSQGKPTEESLVGIYGKDVKKTGNISIKSMLEGGRTIEIGESKDQIKIYINNLQKDKDRNVSLKNKYLTFIEDGASDLKKLKGFDGKLIELSPSNRSVKIKDEKSAGVWLKNVEYKLDKDKKELKRLDDYIFNLDHDIKAMEDALKKVNTGNKRVRFDERDNLTSRKSPSYKGFEVIEGVVLREGKTIDGGLVYTVRDDKGGIYSVDAKKAKIIGNKNVVTLKSIPKRIDLDKKSDLEKAIKDITDLSKDYERGIKVNDDDKYTHDKFVGLLKEANDEVKELKKVLAKLV